MSAATCAHHECADPVVATVVWQTAAMPVPAYGLACQVHAEDDAAALLARGALLRLDVHADLVARS